MVSATEKLHASRSGHFHGRASPQRPDLASCTEHLLDGLERDGQMMGVAGERKKAVFRVERGGLIVDRLHLDRPKGDLAGEAEAASSSSTTTRDDMRKRPVRDPCV